MKQQHQQQPQTMDSLSHPVCAAVAAHLGVQDPRLVVLLKGLLSVHSKWFQQQCADDRFEVVLGIRALKSNGDGDGSSRRASADRSLSPTQELAEALENTYFAESDREQAERGMRGGSRCIPSNLTDMTSRCRERAHTGARYCDPPR